MNSKRLLFIILFLLILPLSYAEDVSLVLGEQYNFSANGSSHAIELIGIANQTATFIVSGIRVGPAVGESRVMSFTGALFGDAVITLNSIMPNSTANITLDYNASEKTACLPIDEKCAVDSDCCVGKCIEGICNYPPTPVLSATQNVKLDAPANVTPGSIATIKLSMEDGTPVASALLDVVTPSLARLTLTTNDGGEGSYLAAEEGKYSYEVYGYILTSNVTTLSGTPPAPVLNNTEVNNTANATVNQTPPPAKSAPFCGDSVCNNDENCSTCPQDCGECVQPLPATSSDRGYSSLLWIGVMILAIIIILRVLLPVFVRE